MERGEMLAKYFFPSISEAEGAENVIYIGHKLTSTNIKLRKRIVELQKANKVKSKRFRNNKLQIQLPNEERWHDVTTFDFLNKIASE